jgi:hypothetical protein
VGHELSVLLLLLEVVEVVEIVITWDVSLELEARTGAEAEVIVAVVSVVTVWLAVAVLVVVTSAVEAEAVNVRVDVLAGMDGVTTVVTTMRLMELGEVCDKVVTTVTAEAAVEEGTPIESLVSKFWHSWRMDRVVLHPTVAQTSPGIQHPPPMSLAHGVLPATH